MAETIKHSTLIDEEREFSDIIGRLVEQWGFKRHLGRIWSLLYLRQHPLKAADIQYDLGLSAGNVNALLNELRNWGVIRRVRIPNDRNIYYEVETHIWKSISNVVKARELRILEEALQGLHSLEDSLKGKEKGGPEIRYQHEQVLHVYRTVDAAFALGSLLVNASPNRLKSVKQLIGKIRAL